MKQIKCANCGRTQLVERMPETQGRAMTPFERQRQRWFYVEGLDVVLCGGSLRADGIDDGRDWCLHMHRENNLEEYRRKHNVITVELFLPGMTGHVPEAARKFLEDVPEPEPARSSQ